MTFFFENEAEAVFDFKPEDVLEAVCGQVLTMEKCPYEVQVNVLLTDNEGIWEFNRQFRGIDRPTDVLSFPNLIYETPSDFSGVEESHADCFDPDSGELILGDIVLSADRIREQAAEYGHSEKREFAFLVAHSMLHLCGYDHELPEEASVMEEKQRAVLDELMISRKG